MVRRFDREIRAAGVTRRGYVSARTVFLSDPRYTLDMGSYGRLARYLGQYGESLEQRTEVYRRMVFNCAVSNTDDHELNHALVQKADGNFMLAPAFDIVPNIRRNETNRHALLIGDNADATVENLLSNVEAFGLTRQEGHDIIQEVSNTIQSQWRDFMYESGFGDWEINRLEHCFAPIPIRRPDPPGRSANAPRPR